MSVSRHILYNRYRYQALRTRQVSCNNPTTSFIFNNLDHLHVAYLHVAVHLPKTIVIYIDVLYIKFIYSMVLFTIYMIPIKTISEPVIHSCCYLPRVSHNSNQPCPWQIRGMSNLSTKYFFFALATARRDRHVRRLGRYSS